MTGIGGDCFALVKPAGTERVEALNGSGRAPASASAARLRAAGHDAVPPGSADAVTVPGAVDGFCALLDRHGRLGLADVLGPVIPYFEAGVPVAPRVAFDWAAAVETLSPRARTHYLASGAAPAPGARFALPAQAEALRRIAAEGRAGFYEGPVMEDMLAALGAAGGGHAAEDFAATRATWGEPISGDYRGVDLLEHAPNGQGATAILMANILARFDLAAMAPWGAERAHLEAEAAKLAYDARDRILADPDHTARLAHMLSADTAERLAALIDPRRAMPQAAPVAEAIHRDTIYITVVDRDRMAVSLIYSIFHSFGSGLCSERFGILFQNRGAGFTLAEGHPNEMAPGKRPMHTIIPAMLAEGGRVTMPFGVMGGAYQPAGHVRMLTNLRDYGLDPQSAIDAPRSFPEGGVLKVERGYGDAVRAALAELGHAVEVPEVPLGGAQAVRIDPAGHLEGASDPRKDGCALGY
jgi:gamma-glutamyltranspeptidase/glutathione hydrolase